MPQNASTNDEIGRCFEVMAELRPHLKREEFLPLVRRMEDEGFRLAYIEDGGKVVCVAGYRIYTSLALGRNLYLDDLATSSPARSRGHGQAMLTWLRKVAEAEGCRVIQLESGTRRHQAHRFYFRHGFAITSYHFTAASDGCEPQR